MIIKSINLTNFRNHNSYTLSCNPDTTLILGENGCGKTSVLEAIYIVTRGKSFRATDQDIIKRGAPFYRIELENSNNEKITATYDKNNKTYHILDKKFRRLPKQYKYPIVLFLPSDLNLISGSPSRHRDYFDRIFSQINEEYNLTLSRYEKALRQRNEILKSDNPSKSSIFSWNILLAKYGSLLYRTRQLLIDEINLRLTDTYVSIANSQDLVNISYKTSIIDGTESTYLNTLESDYEKDLYLGHTSFGVHKDDFEFIFNNNLADGSASRGESRSIILALKFIEADMIFEELHQKPIILLDDVFSELDNSRRKCLVDNFKNHQVIITSVEDFTHQILP